MLSALCLWHRCCYSRTQRGSSDFGCTQDFDGRADDADAPINAAVTQSVTLALRSASRVKTAGKGGPLQEKCNQLAGQNTRNSFARHWIHVNMPRSRSVPNGHLIPHASTNARELSTDAVGLMASEATAAIVSSCGTTPGGELTQDSYVPMERAGDSSVTTPTSSDINGNLTNDCECHAQAL